MRNPNFARARKILDPLAQNPGPGSAPAKCMSYGCTTQASWPYSCNIIGLEIRTCHLSNSWAVSGNREESLFQHAPQSIPAILGSLLTCYNQWKHWIRTPCLQELFSIMYKLADHLKLINKMQTSLSKSCYFWFDPSPSHKCKTLPLTYAFTDYAASQVYNWH